MQTLTEKIISNYIDKKSFKDFVKQGSAYWIEPAHVMSHDNSAAIRITKEDFCQKLKRYWTSNYG